MRGHSLANVTATPFSAMAATTAWAWSCFIGLLVLAMLFYYYWLNKADGAEETSVPFPRSELNDDEVQETEFRAL
jgi:hypothetical protein